MSKRGRDEDRGGERHEVQDEGNSSKNPKIQSTIKSGGAGVPLSLSRPSTIGAQSACGHREPSPEIGEGVSSVSQQLRQSYEKRTARILGNLRRSTGYYLSDVIKCTSNEHANEVAEILQRGVGLFKRGIVLISIDKDHVHVVHDCAHSNKSCRCAWIKKAEIMSGFGRRARSSRGRPLCSEIRLADLQNILKYFSLPPRQTVYIKSGGQVERLLCENSSVEEQGSEGCESVGLADEEQESEQGDTVPLFGEEYPGRECAERNRRGREAVARKKASYVGGKQVSRMQKMMDMFKMYPMSPVEGILNHPNWLLDEDLKFLNAEDKEVKAALNNWTKQLCAWNIEDYNVVYSQENCKPVFSAGYGKVEDYYYDVKTSVAVLEELLMFQFGNDEEYVSHFVTDLFNVLERKIPKSNALLVISPPSAGKNYFFDCIKDYYINVGHVSKLNKWNSFPLQDAEGRRLVFINEPNYSEEWIDTLKMLCGGDSTNVSVKYKAEAPIYRTPILILTNNHISIMSHPAFVDRVKQYKWQSAAYLKDYDKKPNPLATYELFKKYNLVA